MSELKFTRKNNEEYKTTSINIENALIEIKENDYYIFDTQNTKFGYRKVNLKINNEDIREKLKSWETEINEYLKNEVGTGPVTIVYGNKLYTKLLKKIERKKEEEKFFIKISGVWINEENKPFVQLYYVEHIALLY